MINLRASSFGDLFDCPARWEAKHIDGLHTPTTGSAQLGTALHIGTAIIDQAKIDQENPEMHDVLEHAMQKTYESIWHADSEVWENTAETNAAEQTSMRLLTLYERETRMFMPVAVEEYFPKLEITDLDISISGTVDRIYQHLNADNLTINLGIADLKTGVTAVSADGTVSGKKHSLQLAAYEILASQRYEILAPALVIGLNTGKTEKAQRVASVEVRDAGAILLGTEESPGMLEMAARVIHSGSFFGNPRSMLCHDKYCPIFNSCKYVR